MTSSGTKSDLRTSDSKEFVTLIEAEKLKEFGVFSVVECSSKEKTNLDNVFVQIVRAIRDKKAAEKAENKGCTCVIS